MSRTATDIVAAIRDAGVVGAGGAGFPTHAKLANRVDTFIANGAECEPILEADKHVMQSQAADVVRGLVLAMEETGAERGIIAIKDKNASAIEAMKRASSGDPRLSIATLANTYPAGDEFVLIRQVTGRVVPPGGLPFTVGVSVSNVITLKNIAAASDGIPVTTRILTVGGEVGRPVTVEAPVGARIADLIDYAGGAMADPFAIIVGGAIMGTIAAPGDSITKTTGGVIVLPEDHTVVRLKRQPVRVTKLRAKMCCTCQECTILCPRNALGHPISPAKMMSYSWHIDEIIAQIERGDMTPFTERMVYESMLCCQCGICEQYACIFGLSPNKVYALVKGAIARSGRKYDFSKMPQHDGSMFAYRKIPALTYTRKLDLERYLGHTEYERAGAFMPDEVRIPLRQHIGAPAVSKVGPGDTVHAGDVIGEIPEGSLGARVHASIDGRVTDVSDGCVTIVRR